MRPKKEDSFDDEEIRKRRKEQVNLPGNLGKLTLPPKSPTNPLEQAQSSLLERQRPRISALLGTDSDRDSVATNTTFVAPRPASEETKDPEMFKEQDLDAPVERISINDLPFLSKKKKTGGIFTMKRGKKKRKPLQDLGVKKTASRVSGNSGSKLLVNPQRNSDATGLSSNPVIDDNRSSMTPEARGSNNRDAALSLSIPVGKQQLPPMNPKEQSLHLKYQIRQEEQERNKRLQIIILVLVVFGMGVGIGYFLGVQTAPTKTEEIRVFVTNSPTDSPTIAPTPSPTENPTISPTPLPTESPTTKPPTDSPTVSPTNNPTLVV